MNGLDLFSGIGGIAKALEGYVQPVAYCENDRYAQAVLLSRMGTGDIPTAPIYDDVKTLQGSDLHPVDIISGGFPCQDISIAGRGKGLEGKRSGLFFEIMRLANEIRPHFIFLENVPAIRHRGGYIVGQELASRGYDCRWITLSAQEVGANHLRKRWFLLAHANGKRRGEPLPKRVSRFKGAAPKGSNHVAVASHIPNPQKDPTPGSIGKKEKSRDYDSGSHGREVPGNGWWLSEPAVGRMVDGVSCRVDRLRGLGNAVVPAQAREAFERLMGLKNEMAQIQGDPDRS